MCENTRCSKLSHSVLSLVPAENEQPTRSCAASSILDFDAAALDRHFSGVCLIQFVAVTETRTCPSDGETSVVQPMETPVYSNNHAIGFCSPDSSGLLVQCSAVFSSRAQVQLNRRTRTLQ